MYNIQTVYKDEDFKLSLEELDGELFIHVKMETASRPILERILEEFAKVKAKAYWEGYEAIHTYTKDPRIFKVFPLGEVIGEVNYNGEIYKVGKWELN